MNDGTIYSGFICMHVVTQHMLPCRCCMIILIAVGLFGHKVLVKLSFVTVNLESCVGGVGFKWLETSLRSGTHLAFPLVGPFRLPLLSCHPARSAR